MCNSMLFEEMPTTRLPNGVVIGNFSSGHEFCLQDKDGTETFLPACSEQRVQVLQLSSSEIRENRGLWTDLESTESLPQIVLEEIERCQARDDVDIIIVSWKTMRAWKELGREGGKLRSSKWKDQQDKKIYSDKFYR